MSKYIHPRNYLIRLIKRYLRNQASSDEVSFLEKYYSYFDKEKKISDSFSPEEIDKIEKRIFENIKSEIDTHDTKNIYRINFLQSFRYAAAVIIVILVISTLLVIKNDSTIINPGDNNKEVLTQNNYLATIENGSTEIVSQQSGTKSENIDSLVGKKNPLTKDNKEHPVINTVSTPRGGEYKLTLPDGTKVWMNSASTIEFPDKFVDNERMINVTGEIYLEVSKDPSRPFIVTVNNSTKIKVLGTHFNIKAYPEEKTIKTTLLEGSVQVINSSGFSVNLSPGQQLTTDIQGNTSVKNANIDEVMAWMKGIFQFNSLSIDEIMRQVSRWYNVEVIYQNEKPTGKYSGIVNRNTNLVEVLSMLELSGIVCKIEGDSVIVI